MSSVSEILENLSRKSLKRLCGEFDLRVSGLKGTLQKRLHEFLDGDTEALLEALRRGELVELLSDIVFELDGCEGRLVRLTRASRDEILQTACEIYIHDWEPDDEDDTPAPRGSEIYIRWDGTTASEPADDDRAAVHDDSAALSDDEQELWDWLDRRLAERDSIRPRIKTLVKKLGRHRANERLRLEAVNNVGSVLARGGFFTEPDLSELDRSPGIDASVRIWREESRLKHSGPRSFQPVPPAPQPRREVTRVPEPAEPRAEISDFARASLQLQFVVSVAASVTRLDQQAREYAVNAVTGQSNMGQSNMGRADTIRLSAMAHKYASGYEDVQPAIKELRALLPVEDRQRLFDHIRAIAPPSPMLDDMLAAYAVELGVAPETPSGGSSGSSGPSGAAPASPAAPFAARDTPPAPAVASMAAEPAVADETPAAEPAEAPPARGGGVRANPLLDDIFGKGGLS